MRQISCFALITVMTAAAAPCAAATIVDYDFSYGGSELANTPYYIFDGANSNLTASASIIHGPAVNDDSGNGRHLSHDANKPPSSNIHTRYVTSAQTGTSGIFLQAAGAVPQTTSGNFSSSLLASGFTIDTRIEVDTTTTGGTGILFSLGDWVATKVLSNGTLSTTIAGTFGNVITGTTSVLRPSAGADRPVYTIKLVYDVKNPGTADDQLSLYLNGNFVTPEAQALKTLSTFNNVNLAMLSSATSSTDLPGFKMDYFTVHQGVVIPEPASSTMAVLAGAGLLLARWRRGEERRS